MDFMCNLKTQEEWIQRFAWEGQSHMANADYTAWKINNMEAGKYKKFKNFKHLVIYNAGHCVPTDQPIVASIMIHEFIENNMIN